MGWRGGGWRSGGVENGGKGCVERGEERGDGGGMRYRKRGAEGVSGG